MSNLRSMLKREVDTFKNKLRMPRLETGFSMLEAVVVVGVLLALAVGGFIAYGKVTENAKTAKVKSAASELHTAAMVANTDSDSATTPQGVLDGYNDTSESIKAEFLDEDGVPITGVFSPNLDEDFCVMVYNVENEEIYALNGNCADLNGAPGGGGLDNGGGLGNGGGGDLGGGMGNGGGLGGNEITEATFEPLEYTSSVSNNVIDRLNSDLKLEALEANDPDGPALQQENNALGLSATPAEQASYEYILGLNDPGYKAFATRYGQFRNGGYTAADRQNGIDIKIDWWLQRIAY